MKAILLIAFFMSSISNTLYAALQDQTCQKQCCTPFETILGENNNVIAYSNCSNDAESELWQYVTLDNDNNPIKTGMKWQCVEYARRWLITQTHYTFASIDHAYQIWDLSEATQLQTGKTAQWLKFTNTKANQKPQKGDLLIYDRSQGPHGHVSVIVDTDEHHAFIGEQNYSNQLWEGNNYARKLLLTQSSIGLYTIEDEGVIGWMRLSNR